MQISGPAVWVVGESIDVSNNGVCLRVALSDLFEDADALTEDSTFELIQIALDEGVKLLFPIASIIAEATPVRVALDAEREGWLQLGCRLGRAFSVLELTRLGLNPAECGPENPMYGPPSEALPVKMNGGQEVRVSLFGVDDRSTRLFEGKLVALGQQSLAVEVQDEDDAHEVLRKIGCLELYFRATRGSEVVWDSRAMIAALPMISAQTKCVEIGLVANTPPTGNLTPDHLGQEARKPPKMSAKRASRKQSENGAGPAAASPPASAKASKKTARKKAAPKKKATKRKAGKKKASKRKASRSARNGSPPRRGRRRRRPAARAPAAPSTGLIVRPEAPLVGPDVPRANAQPPTPAASKEPVPVPEPAAKG